MNGTTIIDWFIDSMSSNTIKVCKGEGHHRQLSKKENLQDQDWQDMLHNTDH